MTANLIKGKGFKGALRYNLDKVNRNVAEILANSFQSASEKTILYEIGMIKVKKPDLKKFFYHTSINFPPNENLSNELMLKIGLDYLKESGFVQHQYIMFRHYDADHPHLHILVNRIGYDGKVLSDSNDFARTEKVLRELEKRYQLTEVTSSKQAKVRAVTKDELEMVKRTDTPSAKMQMQQLIKDVLDSRSKLTCSEFIRALEGKGIDVRLNQASTGYISDISYSFKGITMKGGALGSDFKWTTIRNRIDYEQERDRTVLSQTNAKTALVDNGKRKQKTQYSAGMARGNEKMSSQYRKQDIRDTRVEYERSIVKEILVTDLFATLVYVNVQPESSIGPLSRPRKKKRKKKRRI